VNALDGNAMAGRLQAAFGVDVSGMDGACGVCGATGAVGAQRAWLVAPGAVLRCRACDAVLLVVVEVRGSFRVSFDHLAWLEAVDA